MNRREFLSHSARGAAALTLASHVGWAAEGQGQATVVLVHWPGTAALPGAERAARLSQMVEAGLAKLTGKSGSAAWREFVQPSDSVGLKVNCLAPRRPTSRDLVEVVARGVLSAGVAGERCLVFDRTQRELRNAGYQVGPAEAGYRVVAVDQPEYGWDAEETSFGGVSQQVSSLVSQHLTVLLNLPVLKDHSIAGITGALKNHCGNIRQPHLCHADHGDPHFADVAALPPLASKQKLVIGDGLTIIYDGGPTDRPDKRADLDTLLFSTDPVAHDVVEWQLIEEVRQAKRLRPLARVGRHPSYLQSAAQPPRSLGVADPSKISVVRVELG